MNAKPLIGFDIQSLSKDLSLSNYESIEKILTLVLSKKDKLLGRFYPVLH